MSTSYHLRQLTILTILLKTDNGLIAIVLLINYSLLFPHGHPGKLCLVNIDTCKPSWLMPLALQQSSHLLPENFKQRILGLLLSFHCKL